MKQGTVILVSALATHGQPAPVFPNIKSADLNGRSLNLPGDFPAPFSLVLVAFEMRQQADVDSWRPFVEQARKKRPTLGVFELPTIARGYRLMQFVIDNGMRSGITNRETRAATVTIYSLSGNSGARSLGVRRAADLCRAMLCAVVLVGVPRWCNVSLVAGRPISR